MLISKTFGFTDYEFTKKVEADLDKIAEGIKLYIDIVKPAAEQLKQELNTFIKSVGYSCECGRPLRHLVRKETSEKSGYDFFGCTGYPDCSLMYENTAGKPGSKIITYMCSCKQADLRRFQGMKNGREYDFFSCPVCNLTFDSVDDHPVKRAEKKAIQPSGFKCPECTGDLVRQQGTSKAGKPYDFFGCANYPKCTVSLSVSPTGEPIPKEKSEFKCKECGKDLSRLTGISKKGKAYDFFSCTGYPKCKSSYSVGEDGTPK